MFGIEFSELMVCALVALVVIGPQRLPETVRTVGLWVGRFKRSLRETRETIEQQLGVEDIRRQLHTEEMMRTLDNMKEEIETALNYERMGSKPALENSPLISLNESISFNESLQRNTIEESASEIDVKQNTKDQLIEVSPPVTAEMSFTAELPLIVDTPLSQPKYH